MQQKRLVGNLEEINQDSGKKVYGLDDTPKTLEMGVVQALVVWLNLSMNSYPLKHSKTDAIVVKYLNEAQEADKTHFQDEATSSNLEVEEKMSTLEWFSGEYKQFRCSLETVTDKTEEGSWFCKGFGGTFVGGKAPSAEALLSDEHFASRVFHGFGSSPAIL